MPGTAFADLELLDVQLPAQLRDGNWVAIHRCEPEDEPALREFLAGLCLEARRLRFFTGAVNVARSAHESVERGADRFGLLALDQHAAIVGHAVCVELEETRAEVAVEVADRLHGQGLGTILIERLAQVAERRGIETLTAEVLADNRAMLDVFRDGFDASVAWHGGIEHVEFASESWRLARERFG